MKRVLETELMEDAIQASAYSNADFSESNRKFVDYIRKDVRKSNLKVLDLGCGPGDVDIEFARQFPEANITAIDGSEQMINLAIEKIKKCNLNSRINAMKAMLPHLDIVERNFDIIISKDLLHHLPHPHLLWDEINRLANKQTKIYVMDLIRPDSINDAKQIVESIAPNTLKILQDDFYSSLLASFTIDEVKQQLENYPLKYQIEQITNRHFLLKCQK